MSSKFDEQWQKLFAEATRDVAGRREKHPQATFNKIEEKAHYGFQGDEKLSKKPK